MASAQASVVVGIDGSPDSDQAVDWAFADAIRFDESWLAASRSVPGGCRPLSARADEPPTRSRRLPMTVPDDMRAWVV